MDAQNRRDVVNPLQALLAIPFFFIMIIMTVVCLLSGTTVGGDPLWPKEGQQTRYRDYNRNGMPPDLEVARQRRENRLAAEQGEAPPFPNVVNYFNPRFDNVPDLRLLRQQVRENMEAIFEGVALPWPDINNAGFGPDTIRAIDQELHQQMERIREHAEQQNQPRAPPVRAEEPVPNAPRDIIPDWMLELDPENQPVPAGQRNEEDKATCPICLNNLPARVSVTKPCNHQFCVACLEDWMNHPKGLIPPQPVRCPICRANIERVGNNLG